MNKEKDRLDLTDVIFDGEDDVNIFFFRHAMPITSGVKAAINLERDFGEEGLIKEMMFELKVGIVKYIYDILELLNSNNPEILGNYYADADKLEKYEDFLIGIVAYGKIDKIAKDILSDLKEGKSDHLLNIKSNTNK